jgi:glutamate-1-semialdehyde 2,1-aminomutase
MQATENLVNGLQKLADAAGIPFSTNHAGSMFGVFFTEEKSVTRYGQVMAGNTERFNQFFHVLLDHGVYLAPASYEAGFVSACHTSDIIDKTLSVAKTAFNTIS